MINLKNLEYEFKRKYIRVKMKDEIYNLFYYKELVDNKEVHYVELKDILGKIIIKGYINQRFLTTFFERNNIEIV